MAGQFTQSGHFSIWSERTRKAMEQPKDPEGGFLNNLGRSMAPPMAGPMANIGAQIRTDTYGPRVNAKSNDEGLSIWSERTLDLMAATPEIAATVGSGVASDVRGSLSGIITGGQYAKVEEPMSVDYGKYRKQ